MDDPELIELVELELRELLSKYDFPGTTFHHQGFGLEGPGVDDFNAEEVKPISSS